MNKGVRYLQGWLILLNYITFFTFLTLQELFEECAGQIQNILEQQLSQCLGLHNSRLCFIVFAIWLLIYCEHCFEKFYTKSFNKY